MVNNVRMGENGSELRLSAAGRVKVHVRAAAFLHEKPNPERGRRRYQEQPYWDIERARIGDTRDVAVELVVNGHPVAKQSLVADGALRDLTFEATIERSSWLAVRICRRRIRIQSGCCLQASRCARRDGAPNGVSRV
jgi:hypothetical protein